MNQEQYQQALDRIFDWMDLHEPTRAHPIDDLVRATRCTLVLVVLFFLPLLPLLVVGFLSYSGVLKEGVFHGLVIGFVFMVVSYVWLGAKRGSTKRSPRTLADRLLCRVEYFFRRGAVLLPEEAHFINDLSGKNPRVRSACVSWAAENPSATLTYREYRRLRRVNGHLHKVVSEYNKSAAARKRGEDIREMLNQSKMIDDANSLRQKNLIERSTPDVHTASPRRTL